MTHHLDVAVRRDLAARWCALAEKRLQHLIELFESGRWRRYHSERAFFENVQEAKRAVERWRALAGRPVARTDEAPRALRRERETGSPSLPFTRAPPIEASVAGHDAGGAERAPSASVIDFVALERALKAAKPPPVELAAIAQRYPLLRNAL
jgi:hypothetical protein